MIIAVINEYKNAAEESFTRNPKFWALISSDESHGPDHEHCYQVTSPLDLGDRCGYGTVSLIPLPHPLKPFNQVSQFVVM